MNVLRPSIAVVALLLVASWTITTATDTEVVTLSSSKPPCRFCLQALHLYTETMRQQYQRSIDLATLVSAEFLASTMPDVLPDSNPLMRMTILLLCLAIIPAYLGKQLVTVRHQFQQLAADNQQLKQLIKGLTMQRQAHQQQIEHITLDNQAQQKQIEHLTADKQTQQQQMERFTAESQAHQQQINHLTAEKQAQQQQLEHLTADNEKQMERITADIQAQQKQTKRLTAESNAQQQLIKHLTAGFTKETRKTGDGVSFPQVGQTVHIAIHRTARLLDGKETWTKDPQEDKCRIGMGEYVKGLDVGIQLMSIGERAVISCPPGYATGSNAPPDTTVKFDVELIRVLYMLVQQLATGPDFVLPALQWSTLVGQ